MDRTRRNASALADAVASAELVRVYDGGLSGDRPLEPVPVLTVDAADQVAELRSMVDVAEVTDGHCMCLGDSALEFLAGGSRLAIVGLHHLRHVRWSGWDGDARLADGPGLAAWLAQRGYGAPLARADADAQRRAQALVDEADWLAAAPPSVRDLLPDLVATGQTGHVPDGIVAEAEDRLASRTPDDVQRSRQLLAWFGSGTARCSGYPVYEGIPGRILSRLPISTVLASLRDEPTGGPVWAGALRHLASWRSRTPEDLARVPSEIWDALVSLAESRGDRDTLARLRAARPRQSS